MIYCNKRSTVKFGTHVYKQKNPRELKQYLGISIIGTNRLWGIITKTWRMEIYEKM